MPDFVDAMRDHYAIHGPGYHHASHDHLILCMVLDIVHDGNNSVMVGVSEDGTKMLHVTMVNVHVERPMSMDRHEFYEMCTPSKARASGLNYMASVVMDLRTRRYERVDGATADDPDYSATKARPSLDAPPTSRYGHMVDESQWRQVESQEHKGIVLADIPTVIGSEACWYAVDPRLDTERGPHEFPRLHPHETAGVFLSKGRERIFHTQVASVTNALFKVDDTTFEIRCASDTRIRSTSTLTFEVSGTAVTDAAMASITVKIPHTPKHQTPISALLRMVGFGTAEEAADAIANGGTGGQTPADPIIKAWFEEALKYRAGAGLPDFWAMGREDVALWYSAKAAPRSTPESAIRNVAHIIRDEFAPHEGLDPTPEVMAAKRRFLARVLWRIWREIQGVAPIRNRDHYALKKWDTGGRAIATLFRQLFINFRRNTCKMLSTAAGAGTPIQVVVQTINTTAKRTGSNIRQACATGAMTKRTGKDADTGVTEGINRMNALSTVSHMQSLLMAGGSSHASTDRLQVKSSIFLFECPYETPEGRQIAKRTNMALMATSIQGCRVSDLAPLVMWQIASLMGGDGGASPTFHVLVNGVSIGCTSKVDIAHAYLMHLRAVKYFPFGTEVVLDDLAHQIRVSCEAGAPRAPVGVTARALDALAAMHAHGDSPGLWDAIDAVGGVVWMGPDEVSTSTRLAETMDVALKDPATYPFYVLDPTCAFSFCTNMMFMANRNQAPRITYQCAMGKQAIMSLSRACYWQKRFVPASNSVPLLASRVETFLPRLLNPGIMVNVAIMCMTGYNIDDAVIVNKRAVDMGKFDVMVVQVFKETVVTKGVNRQTLCKPDETVLGRKDANYDKLDPATGLVRVGAKVQPGDVLVGKTCLVKDLLQSRVYDTLRDMSMVMKDTDVEGRVAKVSVTPGYTGNGSRVVRIMVVSRVRSTLGDKFAPRNGQKGVWGLVYPSENMPFDADGVQPDVIMNVHAFPSRMTAGQYHEMVAGTFALLTGRFIDATPFRGGVPAPEDLTPEQVHALGQIGLSRDHSRMMYDGHTGLPLERPVFMGPVLTQQLKHKASNKINARDGNGPVTHMMRQPVEGRANGGGLRDGEMEIAAKAAGGLTQFILSTASHHSDPHEVALCINCGVVAVPPRKPDVTYGITGSSAVCPLCKKSGDNVVDRVPLSFSTKQTLLEMNAMGFDVRLKSKTVPDLVGSGGNAIALPDDSRPAMWPAVEDDDAGKEDDDDVIITSFRPKRRVGKL